jgi:hypothetical protein
MKHFLLCLIILCSLAKAIAQEGSAYIGTRRVQIKDYSIKQLHGQNVLTLETLTTGFYDADGNLVEQYVMQGNLTYQGKTITKISRDPWFKETLHYNHMNLLATRKVELETGETGEYTHLEYDNQGKVLKKNESRIFKETGDTWQLAYNQVGYIQNYSQVIQDSCSRVIEKRVFDSFDDLQQTHYYIYDNDDNLKSVVEVSASDQLLGKSLYDYDDKGNMLKQSLYDSQNQILESTTYTYDEKDRLLQSSYTVWNPRYGHVPNLKRQKDYIYD